MILAAEEINAAGGIKIGKTMHPLQLEIIDTRDEEPGVPTSEVLLAIEKLILQKKSDVIVGGPCMSECGLAAMDLYAKYKILDIVSIGCYTPGWDKKVASDLNKYKYSFRESGSVAWYIKEGVDLLHQIKENHGFTKMFISIDDSAMSRGAAEIVRNLAVKDGWEVVGFDSIPLPQQIILFQKWCHTMKHQGGQAVLDVLKQLDQRGRSSAARELHRQLVQYIGNNVHRMNYPHYLSKGWQIGSGPVESACKTVVGQRLKGAGMRWGEYGADSVCHLRALYRSEPSQWDAFWSRHFN